MLRFTPEGHALNGKFKCPQCGGSAWGTSVPDYPDWSTATGHCHGNDGRDNDGRVSCNFSWSRSQDRKFFVKCSRV